MALRIIISDDDPVILFLHSRLVAESGLDTSPLQFADGSETLSYLENNSDKGNTYFLLLDINMPGMSGWDLLDQINRRGLDGIKVAIVSSSVNREDHKRAAGYPQVVGYLEKPVKAASLQKILEFTGPKVSDGKIE